MKFKIPSRRRRARHRGALIALALVLGIALVCGLGMYLGSHATAADPVHAWSSALAHA